MARKTYGNKDKVVSVRLRPADELNLMKLGTAVRKLGTLRTNPSVTELIRAAIECGESTPHAIAQTVRRQRGMDAAAKSLASEAAVSGGPVEGG